MTQSNTIGVAKINFEAITFPPKTKFNVCPVHSRFMKKDAGCNTQAMRGYQVEIGLGYCRKDQFGDLPVVRGHGLAREILNGITF